MLPTASADLGAAAANLLHRFHRRPQFVQPLVGVLADQSHRPGQRLGPRPGHARVDKGVEHQPLALPQPRHDRHRQGGEQLAVLTARGAPGNRPAVPLLRSVGDPHPLLPRLLAEPRDAPGPGGRRVALTRGGLRQRADDGDLVAVDDQVDRSGEPPVRQPAGEPARDLGAVDRRRRVRPSAATAATAPEARAEGSVCETVSVHGDLPRSTLITRLHGNPDLEVQGGPMAALRADTSVVGAEHTKPRQTWAAAAPPTRGLPASRGTPAVSGSPTTTTAPGLTDARAAA